MSQASRDLEQAQRWLQDAIMGPDGVPPHDVEALLTRSRALAAADRLAIYHSAYHARLIECLREEFPILCRALGQEHFDAFAFGYLQQHPSRSYTLCRLGANFAGYLAQTRPQQDSASWPDFLIELARLEWAFTEIFDGPGVEGQPLFDVTRLATLRSNDWSRGRLQAVCCLRLFTSRYPIHRYFVALKQAAEVLPPEPSPTFLALTRAEYRIRYHELELAEFMMLERLLAGDTIAQSLSTVVESGFVLTSDQVRDWFQRWAENSFFGDYVLAD